MDPATAGEKPAIVNSMAALRMINHAHGSVNQAELALIESIIDNGWTWERLGATYGERSKQAMQQHYKRRGGERNWRERPAGPETESEVKRAVEQAVLTFRACAEYLGRLRGAPWNERDPEQEEQRRRSWVERLGDSEAELFTLLDSRVHHKLPRWDCPFVPGERFHLHDDHVEVDRALVDELRDNLDELIAGIGKHHDTVAATLAELRRRRAELDD